MGLETRSGLPLRIHSSATARHCRCAASKVGIGSWSRRRDPQAGGPLIMRYPIAIEPRTDQSAYGVVVLDLPGCFSAGDTLEEAISGAEEAGLAWIEAALDADDPIPPPSSLEAIPKPEYADWILSLATIDPGALDDTVERVNITLPRRILRRLDRGSARRWRNTIGLYRQARDWPVTLLSRIALPCPSTAPSARPPTSRGGRARRFRPASPSPFSRHRGSSRSARRSRNCGLSRSASDRRL